MGMLLGQQHRAHFAMLAGRLLVPIGLHQLAQSREAAARS
jgi:hypothetical protein